MDGWTDGWMDGRTDGWTDGRTDRRTENLPILQDFVPYQGRCPATAQLQLENCIKQGKGTADHMMPLGDWFPLEIVGFTNFALAYTDNFGSFSILLLSRQNRIGADFFINIETRVHNAKLLSIGI